jgi:hypothetical protein
VQLVALIKTHFSPVFPHLTRADKDDDLGLGVLLDKAPQCADLVLQRHTHHHVVQRLGCCTARRVNFHEVSGGNALRILLSKLSCRSLQRGTVTCDTSTLVPVALNIRHCRPSSLDWRSNVVSCFVASSQTVQP